MIFFAQKSLPERYSKSEVDEKTKCLVEDLDKVAVSDVMHLRR